MVKIAFTLIRPNITTKQVKLTWFGFNWRLNTRKL